MRTLSVTLSDKDYDRLAKVAEESGNSIAKVVKTALRTINASDMEKIQNDGTSKIN